MTKLYSYGLRRMYTCSWRHMRNERMNSVQVQNVILKFGTVLQVTWIKLTQKLQCQANNVSQKWTAWKRCIEKS